MTYAMHNIQAMKYFHSMEYFMQYFYIYANHLILSKFKESSSANPGLM